MRVRDFYFKFVVSSFYFLFFSVFRCRPKQVLLLAVAVQSVVQSPRKVARSVNRSVKAQSLVPSQASRTERCKKHKNIKKKGIEVKGSEFCVNVSPVPLSTCFLVFIEATKSLAAKQSRM